VSEDQARKGPLFRRPTTRLEAFSDGVFAIAITLLVLEIAVPAGSENDLLGAVRDQWPSYLGYLVSFATIGAVWLKHTVIADLMPHTDGTFLRLNLLLLLLVSFLPFPTKLMAEHLEANTGAARVAVVFYGVVLLLIALVVFSLWKYALVEGLVDPTLDEQETRYLTAILAPSLGVYVVAILVGLVAPKVAVGLMLVIAIAIAVPRIRGRA
jgi:TMEM175 potassium channel family protein